MNTQICQAITDRKVIELRYSGYSRIVEPYAHGRSQNGEDIFRCYQLSGGSESGERVGWKILKVCDVSALHITDTHFTKRSDYRRGDKAMEVIYCQL